MIYIKNTIRKKNYIKRGLYTIQRKNYLKRDYIKEEII